jgi:acetyl-CoA carboxylase biotin carboxyl carrier protein
MKSDSKKSALNDLEVPEKLIRKLSDMLKRSELSEIEISKGDLKVRVRAKSEASQSSVIMTAPSTTSGGNGSSLSSEPKQQEKNELHIIRSPFVGTFYSSPSPTSASYAEEGQSISKGQVLCIVEAMKVMNEIESDSAGTLEKLYVENGQPVDFNAPLFGVRK